MNVLNQSTGATWSLAEVEVSITAHCTLACRECGFVVPNQPEPWHGDPVDGICSSLGHLNELGIKIDNLAILGGEPTMFGGLLTRAIRSIRATGATRRIEVVSNGLTPQGLGQEALSAIDRLTISVYVPTDTIVNLWRDWLSKAAPHVELKIRRNEGGWDQWTGDLRVSGPEAQKMYDHCWYRKHCITLERDHLFTCSRIAKFSRDDEGLPISARTTFADVRAYLGRQESLPSCATCVPMMKLPSVKPGVQPDSRIVGLERQAVAWLGSAVEGPQ